LALDAAIDILGARKTSAAESSSNSKQKGR